MTATHKPPRRTSLRALAAELGVHHSSLSAAIADGRLSRGIGRDARGQTTVLDADAAAEQWRGVHTPRMSVTLQRSAPPPPARFYDRRSDVHWTMSTLLDAQRASAVLAVALCSLLRDSADRETLRERVAARLHEIADLHAAEDEDLDRAEHELEDVLVMLEDCDNNNEPKETP